jgi:formate-dependent nitrite reductase membrane component NrfD
MKKEIIIGIITGIAANVLGVILYILAFSDEGIDATLQQSMAEGYFGKIVTLGAVLNLAAFFIFIKKKQDYRARGVLLATIFIGVAVLVRKFI